MLHLPDLIRDLGIILAAATVVILACKALRQPVVLGYLIAGFLVSRHFPFLPSVRDEASIKVWAEIGVIFLLFGLGLEFSFRKLVKVGRSAAVTAVFEVAFMLGLGFLVGRALGWSRMDSLFLGGVLSISSTTIIVRAFGELGLKGRRFVSLVFGVLIVEDLVAILLLVLLSTIAVTKTLSGVALLVSFLRLAFFLLLWFLVGIYLVPLFLGRIRRLLTDETALIVSLGLCLMMVLLATKAGFSPALGAFVMGSILAETSEGKRIEALTGSVRDLFGAVFFVSVGMMIDPLVLSRHFPAILAVTAVTIAGKLVSSAAGALLSGESLRTSVQAGMSLAQIGEFSFIIATLGLSLGVTSDFLYPIAVSASAITTFTTPYLIQVSGALYERVDRLLPERFREMAGHYRAAMTHDPERKVPALLLRAYGTKIFLNSFLVCAAVVGIERLLLPAFRGRLSESPLLLAALMLLALFGTAPFLWAVVYGAPRSGLSLSREEAKALARSRLGALILRGALGMALAVAVTLPFRLGAVPTALVLLLFFSVVLLWNKLVKGVYALVEDRFVANLRHEDSAGLRESLAPWDATLAEVVLSPHSELVAKSLELSRLKERFGVTIGLIERGRKRVLAPGRNEILLPHDRLFLIGTDDQILRARAAMESEPEESDIVPPGAYGLDMLILAADSPFIGKAIRESGFRERVHGLIVGIERDGRRILNPDSTLELRAGDVVWLVGDKALVRQLRARPTGKA